MEYKVGDEALNQRSKRSRTQIPATSLLLPLPSLLPELNTEILSRLPVKSLLQCRCVSKSWHAFISSPQFIKAHLSVSANNKECTHHRLILMFYQHGYPNCILKDCSLRSLLYESESVSDLKCPMKDQCTVVAGSVNGLICLANGANRLFLWNPSTRVYKKLPGFGTNLKGIHRFVYGFGYDERNDDYKVVGCICRASCVDVKIYSLKSGSWRSIDYPEESMECFASGKLVSGKLHWAVNAGPSLSKGWNITSFNLADEKWEKVEQPCYEQEDGVLVLAALGNNLSVIFEGNDPTTDLDVWVMKEYGVKESWTKMFSFKYPHNPSTLLFDQPSLVSKKGEVSIMFGRNVFLYNLNDESITYRKITKASRVGAIYLESLVSPLLQNEEHSRNEGCTSSDGRNWEAKDAVKKN